MSSNLDFRIWADESRSVEQGLAWLCGQSFLGTQLAPSINTVLWPCSCCNRRVDWLQSMGCKGHLLCGPLQKSANPCREGQQAKASWARPASGIITVLTFHWQNSATQPLLSKGGWRGCSPPCPQKTRETGRVVIWPVSATNTRQTLVTSDSACVGPTSFLDVRPLFLTFCCVIHHLSPS